MYKKIAIKRFRCFEDLTIDNLSRINLVSGKNNVGKTSLLEAIWLFKGYHNPELGVRIDLFRGINIIATDKLMLNLFRNFIQEKDIQISCENSEGSKTLTITPTVRQHKGIKLKDQSDLFQLGSEVSSEKSYQLAFSEVKFELKDSQENMLFQKVIYVDEGQIKFDGNDSIVRSQGVFLFSNKIENQQTLAERLSDLIENKRQKEIVDILKIVEPRLINLEIQIKGGQPIIYGDIGKDKTYPLPVMGNGLLRLLSIALSISHAAGGGILLVDEIENGFYWSVMESVWDAISKYADKNDVQIFATTHSWECVKAFQKALVKNKKSISAKMFRLEEYLNKFKVVPYEIDELGIAVEQDIEVR